MTSDSKILAALYEGKTAPQAPDGDLDIFEAAALDRADRVRDILAAEPSAAREQSPDGFTALHLVAFFGGGADCAQALIGAGADAEAVAVNDMQVTPLHSAAARGHVAVAEALLAAGADVHARQGGGFVPLHGAAALGDEAFVELLLENGSDPGAVADEGARPADLAAANQHPELANHLRGLER